MSDRELTRTYEPNPVLRAVYRPFFDRIHVDEAWVTAVRASPPQAPITVAVTSTANCTPG